MENRNSSITGVASGLLPQNIERKLISHVPDLVIFDKNRGQIPHVQKFDGVLLFADVSGFTALTEKYTMSSDKGTDALTRTLNGYIGKIVSQILEAGGDILKFAGDAILAVWKVKERPDLKHAVLQAAKCSLTIQDKCDNQATDVGVKLRVKIAISAGKIYATFVGSPDAYYFVMAGRPVGEVNAAEKFCTAGKVVLSPNAFELCDRDNIIVDPLSDRFSLVRYLRRDPRKHWKDYVDGINNNDIEFLNDEEAIRLSLRIRPNALREQLIRKYVTPVVKRKLDDGQPLEFLSEMRQCSIAFINMAFSLNERDRNFHEKQKINMQAVFEIVHTATLDLQGSLNKIFMFDKGCTFLVIFGLPGDKHEEEPAHALQAAWNIRGALVAQLDTLTIASIGVTTGPVFCGVIGHNERHEYTVIGQKVNLAARLMMHYPDRVSCDEETFTHSKLSSDMFTKLPFVQMKGVGDVNVFEYVQGKRRPVGTTEFFEPEYPILERQDELKLFMDELTMLKNNHLNKPERRVVVFQGEAGYGKTRFIQEINWNASEIGVKVYAFTLSMNDLNAPYFTIRVLLQLLLGVSPDEANDSLLLAIKEILPAEDHAHLCLLNEIISAQLPVPDKILRMSNYEQVNIKHKILVDIVDKIAGNDFLLFSLDDAHNIDNHSWSYLDVLSKSERALCVLTMRPYDPDNICEAAKCVLYHAKTRHETLSAINSSYIGAMVCQFMHVKRLDKEIEEFMMSKSHGVPSWCEQLTREMQQKGFILSKPLTTSKSYIGTQFTTPASYLTKRNINPKSIGTANYPHKSDAEHNDAHSATEITIPRPSSDFVDPSQKVDHKKPSGRMTSWTDRLAWKKSSNAFIEFLRHSSKHDLSEKNTSEFNHMERDKECVLKPGFNLHTFPVPASIVGMALARLDRMKPYQQLVVKTAAVIGSNFSRKMLASILPGFTRKKFQEAMINLIRNREFACASEDNRDTKKDPQLDRVSLAVTCNCHPENQVITDDIDMTNVQAIEEQIANSCEQLLFQNSLVQETAKNLWLEEDLQGFDKKCANFLEAKVNEILITGKADEIIVKQYRISKTTSLILPKKELKISQTCSSVKGRSWHATGGVVSLQLDGKYDIQIKSKNSLIESNEDAVQQTSTVTANQKVAKSPRRVSRSSVIGRMAVERVGATNDTAPPLALSEDIIPRDYVNKENSAEVDEYMDAVKGMSLSTEDMERHSSFGDRRLSYSPMWMQSVGIQTEYEKIIKKTEQEVSKMKNFSLDKVLKTPYEVHNSLSLLYPQLAIHWKRAKNTGKTIEYLLKSAESLIATLNLGPALTHLTEVSKIIHNLSRGRDIIALLDAKVDPAGIEDFQVFSVDKDTKANVENLLGQVYFQQGKLEISLKHFTKALKLLDITLPSYGWTIALNRWHEQRKQRLHKKYPLRYIGKAKSSVANKYAEQVRCLSHIWQIMLNLNEVPNRIAKSKLISLMQVNRAEAADDDLQELITSYTYMIQMQQLAGDFVQAAFYENKATVRCLELPHKLTASDMYITGHLHLVSCSVRICHGKLALGLTSGYRAYGVACALGDADIKLIVLPLLAQVHLLTGKISACIEVLHRLKMVSQNALDDQGMMSYYSTCMDLMLDGSCSLEKQDNCVEYLQSSEAMNNGDAARFYGRASMAVWCYRQGAKSNGHAWLMLADTAKPNFFDSFHAVRAMTRLVEARLLKLRDTIEMCGERTRETKQVESKCSSDLQQLASLCKKFPVFLPRSLHLRAYYDYLQNLPKQAKEKATQAANLARYCGNEVDMEWAQHSLKHWSGDKSTQTCEWSKICNEFPIWNSNKMTSYFTLEKLK